ncbi:Chaperone protein dnaJ 20, chloroplastic [Vitis vinifera]|uniref:Chaperone protein dnaJ 20, chloroplastic n=1 Tax=Vitis vinifera TaxID=29760 RepID=A0A438I7V3_VITVI|nr:Chaperone protein dnaJ 20, chloroplastic [Vitis vinifera]
MSYGSTGHDFLVCSKPCLPGAKSMLKPSPNHLIFNTNLPKPAFSLKTPSGYFTTRAKTAINSSHNLYLTEEASESFYCLLGVSEAATLSEIKQAYKQLVLKYHPDVSPPDSAKEFTRMFIRIQEAYETLSDPRLEIYKQLYWKIQFLVLINLRHQLKVDPVELPVNQGMDMSGDWKSRWQAQLGELERKSASRNSNDNKSWAARVRMRRSKSSI